MSLDDKITLEILANRYQAVVDEMAQVLFRTAHTVFVKETQDYGTVLVSPGGEVFAAPRRYGVMMMVGMPMGDAIAAMGDDVREGDVFISNDPEATRGMCTHLSDVFLWKPVFHDGEIVCYAWTFIHVSDVGGAVPGSIQPSSYEIYQEGIRVPPRKLYSEGVLDEAFLDMFKANCRTPEQNWGDMKACLASLTTAERHVHELIEQFGIDTITGSIPALLDYGERQARRVISGVPDGVYRFSDFLEGDMAGLGLIRINITLTIKGDDFLMDFTGSAPQVRAALNLPSYSKDGHWMLITALINWFCTQEPTIAYNAGLARPLRIYVPEGTILNPQNGSAYGARYATSHKVCDVAIGALAQAVPMQLPATDSGQGSILLVSVPDFATGERKVSVIQPIVGGAGARPMDDGVDGTMVLLNFLKNIPTAVFEREMPEILIHHYGLRPDSGGAGRYRGGTGIEIEFETRVPFTTVTSRSMERYIFPPPGRLGGQPGATGYTLFKPRRRDPEDIGKIDLLDMDVGDRLRIGTQGGGGFGHPFDRPEDDVLEDVLNGLVSRQTAESLFGVIVSDAGTIDAGATRARRESLRAEADGAPTPQFGFGPVRLDHYRRWPDAVYDAMDAGTADLPPVPRQAVYYETQRRIEDIWAVGDAVAPGDVPGLVAAVREDYGGI